MNVSPAPANIQDIAKLKCGKHFGKSCIFHTNGSNIQLRYFILKMHNKTNSCIRPSHTHFFKYSNEAPYVLRCRLAEYREHITFQLKYRLTIQILKLVYIFSLCVQTEIIQDKKDRLSLSFKTRIWLSFLMYDFTKL